MKYVFYEALTVEDDDQHIQQRERNIKQLSKHQIESEILYW